jgi:hypothetical protein
LSPFHDAVLVDLYACHISDIFQTTLRQAEFQPSMRGILRNGFKPQMPRRVKHPQQHFSRSGKGHDGGWGDDFRLF